VGPALLAGSREELFGDLPEHLEAASRLWCDVRGKDAVQHTRHVGIDQCGPLFVGKAGHGTGGVRSDAGQFAQLYRFTGNHTVLLRGHLASQRVQVPRACIVAEPLPRLHHTLGPRPGQTVQIGEPIKEAPIEVQHTRDLRLLQHQLGDEHAIRVAGSTPRQVPRVRAEPPLQRAPKGSGVPRGNEGGIGAEACGHGRREATPSRPFAAALGGVCLRRVRGVRVCGGPCPGEGPCPRCRGQWLRRRAGSSRPGPAPSQSAPPPQSAPQGDR
jgi:hypothetical protein